MSLQAVAYGMMQNVGRYVPKVKFERALGTYLKASSRMWVVFTRVCVCLIKYLDDIF